jgi:copper(I)-binding protein
VGDSVVLTLKLKNAGILVVTAPIRNAPPEAMSGSMGGMDMHH